MASFRDSMEHQEAAMWKQLKLMEPGESRDFFAKDHKRFLSALAIIERDASRIARCVECGRPSANSCGGCGDAYCDVSCQRRDWSRHKIECKLSSDDRAKRIASSFVASPTPDKPYSVFILLRKGAFTVQMSKEDMTDYESYVKAVQAVVSSFDKSKDMAWQHWTSVREAFA